MDSQIAGLRVAGVLFGLMAVLHIARLGINPDVLIAGRLMPLWPSLLAIIILSGLSLWMCWLAHPSSK